MSTELLIFFLPLCKNAHNCFFSFLGLEDRGQKKKFCSLQDIISAWYSHLHWGSFHVVPALWKDLNLLSYLEPLVLPEKCEEAAGIWGSALIYSTMKRSKEWSLGCPEFSRAKRLSADRVGELWLSKLTLRKVFKKQLNELYLILVRIYGCCDGF